MGNQQLQLHIQSDKVRKTETKAKSAFRSIVSAIYILLTIYTLQLVDNMAKVLITFIAMMGLLMLDVGETVQSLALPDVNSGAVQFISRMKRQAPAMVVADECKVAFDDVKNNDKLRYVIFYIKDFTSINVETLGNKDASYDDFLHDLQKSKDCRYGLYSYKYDQCPGTIKVKMFMMLWNPHSCKMRAKMLYDGARDNIKKELVGVSKYMQATEPTDAAAENVEKELRQMDKEGC